MPSTKAAVPQKGPAHFTPAQLRIIEAALVLFAKHGVSGTSLQMIADTIGVTKAAVYHRFQSKDQIVLAVAEVVLAGLEAAVDTAEAQPSPSRAHEVLIAGMIDLGVESRLLASVLQRDPIMLRFVEEHEPFRRVMERLNRVLMGGGASAKARVRTAMLASTIAGTVIHPLVLDLDDETLRTELLHLVRRFIRVAT
jgi:AcrR family transcriptional regulator